MMPPNHTYLAYLDGEAFIASMIHGIQEGDTDFVEANMPALERLIGKLESRGREVIASNGCTFLGAPPDKRPGASGV